jgi:excisionase family DNA binding protein
MSDEIDDIRWMTVDEVSKYLRVTKATVYTYMKEGKLPYFYLAGTRHRRVKKSDVDALLIPGKPEEDNLTDDSD